MNDSIEVAKELGNLLLNRQVLLNVIPYNKTAVPFDYETPARKEADAFVETVRSFGVKVLFR